MKKIALLLAAALLVACNTEKGYNIKISVEELAGKDIILRKRDGRAMVTIDSVTLDSSGIGQMAGSIEAPQMMYIAEKGTNKSLPIFMDNYKYEFNGPLDEPSITSDGGAHAVYEEYSIIADEIKEKQAGIMGKYYDGLEAGMSQDSLQLLMEAYYATGDELAVYDSSYLADNANIMSLYILRRKFYSYTAQELESKLAQYDETLHATDYYSYLDDHLGRMKSVDIGEKYVDFSMQDTSGTFRNLADFAEKGYLLIDFWASWCQPCRKANPGVVKIYNEFSDKGFDIVGVSLDNSKKKWKDAIVADNLTWHQMSDLQGWESKGANIYAVASIPHTVLLDKEGTIIARNLSEEELREKLTELLGS